MSTLTVEQVTRARRRPDPADTAPEPGIDLTEMLFLAAALVAPVSLRLVANVTVDDVLVLGTAVLMLANGRHVVALPRSLAVAAYVFVLAVLVSTFRATHPLESLTQLAQYAFIFFVQLPVVLSIARTRAMVLRTLAMFAVGSLFVIAQAMAEPRAQSADRALSLISDNPNRLGYPTAYLLPFVLLGLLVLWRSRRWVVLVLVTPLSAYLLLWPLAASASRGAVLATLVAALVFVVLRPGSGVIRSVGRLMVVSVLVAGLGWLVLNSNEFPSTLRERVQRTVDPAERRTLVGDREMLARAGIRSFEHSPFVGTGLDNFRYVAVRYEPAATNQVPHNLWIQLLAQTGLVGTLAFGWFLAYWFWVMYRGTRTRARAPDASLLWAFVAAMAAVMAILMTIPSMNQRHYWLLYGLGLALLTATPTLRSATRRRTATGRTHT